MTVGVKYCGGCNPRMDRTAFLARIKEKLPDMSFDYVNPEKVYEKLLVICGCPSQCADISAVQVTGPVLWVWEADRLGEIVSKLSQ